jgi:hypothetical protein
LSKDELQQLAVFLGMTRGYSLRKSELATRILCASWVIRAPGPSVNSLKGWFCGTPGHPFPIREAFPILKSFLTSGYIFSEQKLEMDYP